jgi:hypothetical protein
MMMFGTYRINQHTEKPPRLHLQFEDGELNFYACLLQLIEEPLDNVYHWHADIMSGEWDTNKGHQKDEGKPRFVGLRCFDGSAHLFGRGQYHQKRSDCFVREDPSRKFDCSHASLKK